MPPRLISSTPRIAAFLALPPPPPLRQCAFSTSGRFLADDSDHYATLEVPPNATHAEIKRYTFHLVLNHPQSTQLTTNPPHVPIPSYQGLINTSYPDNSTPSPNPTTPTSTLPTPTPPPASPASQTPTPSSRTPKSAPPTTGTTPRTATPPPPAQAPMHQHPTRAPAPPRASPSAAPHFEAPLPHSTTRGGGTHSIQIVMAARLPRQEAGSGPVGRRQVWITMSGISIETGICGRRASRI